MGYGGDLILWKNFFIGFIVLVLDRDLVFIWSSFFPFVDPVFIICLFIDVIK